MHSDLSLSEDSTMDIYVGTPDFYGWNKWIPVATSGDLETQKRREGSLRRRRLRAMLCSQVAAQTLTRHLRCFYDGTELPGIEKQSSRRPRDQPVKGKPGMEGDRPLCLCECGSSQRRTKARRRDTGRLEGQRGPARCDSRKRPSTFGHSLEETWGCWAGSPAGTCPLGGLQQELAGGGAHVGTWPGGDWHWIQSLGRGEDTRLHQPAGP